MFKISDKAYDGAIIGVTADERAVYDYDKMVDSLMKRDGMTLDEAIGFIENNTLPIVDQMGDNAPIIMYELEENEEVTDLSDAPEEIKEGILRNAEKLEKRDEAITTTGDIVLDPFAGSGTTGAVAVQEGRDFIGIEINPTYSKMSEQRIQEAAREGANQNGQIDPYQQGHDMV